MTNRMKEYKTVLIDLVQTSERRQQHLDANLKGGWQIHSQVGAKYYVHILMERELDKEESSSGC